jgi:hypothetical protein
MTEPFSGGFVATLVKDIGRNYDTDPSKYEYVGCFKDSNVKRTLPDVGYAPFNVRSLDKQFGQLGSQLIYNEEAINNCYTLAKGNKSLYFGLQAGGDCMYKAGSMDPNDTSYRREGVGDANECQKINGGQWTNKVYKLKNTETHYKDSANGFTYLGCYNDGGDGSIFSSRTTVAPYIPGSDKEYTYSPRAMKYCYDAAKRVNSLYFGLQNGGECMTEPGNMDKNDTNHRKFGIAPAGECEKINGGPTTIQVYKLPDPPDPIYVDPTGDKYVYEGCYKADSDIFPRKKRVFGPSDDAAFVNYKQIIDDCYQLAKDNDSYYFGLTDGGHCVTDPGSLNTDNSKYKSQGVGDGIECAKINGGIITSQLYRMKLTNEQRNIHDAYNTPGYGVSGGNTSYLNQPSNANYTYKGCWADDKKKITINNGTVSDADQCYQKAYTANHKYFGLQGSTCYGANDDAYTTEEKGFRSRCGTAFGGTNTNQVYELRYTKSDADAVVVRLTTILEKIMSEYAKITEISGQIATIAVNIDNPSLSGTGAQLNGIGYANRAFTALTEANNSIASADVESKNGFNYSALALQYAESARRVSQDLTQQQEASQIAQNALSNASNAATSTETAKSHLSNAESKYNTVISIADSAILEASGVSTSLSSALLYFKSAIDSYQAHYTNSLYKSYIDTPEITTKISEIVYYTGTTTTVDTATEGKMLEYINRIKGYINNTINPLLEKIRGYRVIALNQTQRNELNSIVSQTQAATSIANTNSYSIISSTKSEIARMANLAIIAEQQQTQLANADAATAKILQDQINEAEARQAKLNLEASIVRATKAQLAFDRSLVQVNSINKQNSLMDKINKNIVDLNILTTLEGFTNPLPTNSNQEINNYVKTFNNGLALLDDPNQMTKVAFDTYLHIQDKKLEKLNTDLDDLKERADKNIKPTIKSIRSMSNSAVLNLEPYPAEDPTMNPPKYLIYGNNGCLQYENKHQDDPYTWNFKPCDAGETKQKFKINHIDTLQKYNEPITNPSYQKYKINDKSNTNLGFYTVNPNDDHDQCLQLNNDGVSVLPCNMDSAQKFSVNYHNVL